MKKLLFLLLVAILAACGPMEHKRYDYTVSGTIYTDRETKMPVANWAMNVVDFRYSDVTVGASLEQAYQRAWTDENGHFSMDIHGGLLLTQLYTSAWYDVRDGSIWNNWSHLKKGDEVFLETRDYYSATRKKDIYNLTDMEIYLAEEGIMGVEPLAFRRNDEITITLPEYAYTVEMFSLHKLAYHPDTVFRFWDSDNDSIGYGVFYDGLEPVYVHIYRPSKECKDPVSLQLHINDSIPAGYYSFTALVYTAIECMYMECTRIVQIVDD